MNRGFPSMTALLGLLAVAGYQNRDKMMEMMKGQAPQGATPQGGQGSSSASLGGLLGGMGNAGIGGLLVEASANSSESFNKAAQEDVADFVGGDRPKQGIGAEPARTSGWVRCYRHAGPADRAFSDEIVSRLTRELPHAVDKYTPDGRLPSESEFRTS